MLESARFQNLTRVPDDEWKFKNLNVIIGENGLGKSHVLKVIYSLLKVQSEKIEFTKTALSKAYADKLSAVMRPEELGRLVRRQQGRGRCEIELTFKKSQKGQNCEISFASNAKSLVNVETAPTQKLELSPVYLPTRELLTLCPWFLPLYDNYHVDFEETWRDTISLLGAPSVKGPRENSVAGLLRPLEEAMGGKVIVDTKTGRFYLQINGEGRMEMPLVAEGLRKVAMLARLISTGVFLEQGYLFWDEPETNLNPKLIKIIAAIIVALANQGIQIFIATHSLFLLRELEIQRATKPAKSRIPIKYFGLALEEGEVTLQQADSLSELDTITALDESLDQSDRYMDL